MTTHRITRTQQGQEVPIEFEGKFLGLISTKDEMEGNLDMKGYHEHRLYRGPGGAYLTHTIWFPRNGDEVHIVPFSPQEADAVFLQNPGFRDLLDFGDEDPVGYMAF